MSKVCLITDLHFGVRGGSEAFMDNQRKFMRQTFFPLIQKENISGVIMLGDLCDRRKGIDFKVANFMRTEFLQPLAQMDIPVDIICGNHDLPSRSNMKHSSLEELVNGNYRRIEGHIEPAVIDRYGPKFLLVPWICDSNRDDVMRVLNTSDADVVFAHLELKGFKMYRNTPVSEHGMDPDILSRFKHVYTGHFHSSSTQGNITYLGAAWEMTWSDHDDPKGFHILDTETLELTFYRNPFTMFQTINYHPKTSMFKDGKPTHDVKGKIVRVIIKERDAKFDTYLEALEDAGAVEVQVVEQPVTATSRDDVATDEENGDVLSVLKKSVQELGNGVDQDALFGLLEEIHTEATQGV